ncbi:hypothetical protein [Methylobacterium oxalidis]|uniref:Uncharacterized protein n=1 Tax=Methylobacterium oxalidis TaxID=944322 RepID=A0A512J3I6_9HYPH|nr:hypothetical protein [Methylobacterium oxalidis]GEP04500.1 hypothetical protein MOX02_25380 [Methylobacterium oxalidis]GJE35372.1 hypothetical protein LDDCCGHA_5590 [Methylobacterium oxalidis]GLS64779.1 hypothetical protein GCM10007888_31600 [Methylobacterium oxalidis]
MLKQPEPALLAASASAGEAPLLDAWCAEEVEKAATVLERYGEAAIAATMRSISLLHRVRALELGLRHVAGDVAETGAAVWLASHGDDGKDGAVQSP